ncbi:MAG: hypothetical protein KF768_06635 [Phycisphaeraceae bacterium]|nr:hypothetical protein [Phycisphaeraceae bacterium]
MRAEVGVKAKLNGSEAAVEAVVAGLPRDQALGLRLLCLARTAAAMHMSQACALTRENCAMGAPAGGRAPTEGRP